MIKPVNCLVALMTCCLIVTTAGCGDSGVAPNAEQQPAVKLSTILRSAPLLIPATESTLLTELSASEYGSLQIEIGNTIGFHGRAGGMEFQLLSMEVVPTVDVGDLIRFLDPRSEGVDVVVAFNDDSRLTFFNVMGQEIDDFGAFISGNSAFIRAMNFGGTLDYGLTVSDTVLLGPASGNTPLYELHDAYGQVLSTHFREDTTILVGGSLGPNALQPGILSLDANTTLADLLAMIETVFGLDTGAAVIDEFGQIIVTGRPGTIWGIGDMSIAPNTIMTVFENAFSFAHTQQAEG